MNIQSYNCKAHSAREQEDNQTPWRKYVTKLGACEKGGNTKF